MQVLEIVCDRCENVTTSVRADGWFVLKDSHDVQYHFCTWECLTIYGWLMAEWEQSFKHSLIPKKQLKKKNKLPPFSKKKLKVVPIHER